MILFAQWLVLEPVREKYNIFLTSEFGLAHNRKYSLCRKNMSSRHLYHVMRIRKNRIGVQFECVTLPYYILRAVRIAKSPSCLPRSIYGCNLYQSVQLQTR